jgi:hypothetical protein
MEVKSYRGQSLLPTPESVTEGSFEFIIVPWGDSDSVSTIHDSMTSYLLTTAEDLDSTSPFPIIEGLSTYENRLRIALELANQQLYQQNEEEFSKGAEALIYRAENGVLNISYWGMFNVCIWKSSEQALEPIEWTILDGHEVYLPTRLLGTSSSILPKVSSVNVEPGDCLVVFQCPQANFSSIQNWQETNSLSGLSQMLTVAAPDFSHWVCIKKL